MNAENTHTGQISPQKTASTDYSVPLDYVVIAVSFFVIGFFMALSAVKVSANQVKVIHRP